MIAASLLNSTRTIPTEFSAFFLPKWGKRAQVLPAGLVPIPVALADESFRDRRYRLKELERLSRIAGFTP